MGLMDDMTREEAKALLDYREDVAGGLMNPRFARLRPEESIEHAITYLRQQLSQVEMIYYAYVLDEEQRLLGVVSLKDLVRADASNTVSGVMTTKIFKVSDVTDQKEIAHLLTTHGVKAIPVVDTQGRMKGIVTVNDVIDVLRKDGYEGHPKGWWNGSCRWALPRDRLPGHAAQACRLAADPVPAVTGGRSHLVERRAQPRRPLAD